MARSFKIESIVRGHHVFKNIWTPTIGEDLRVTAESDNTFDEFAMAVCKDNIVVGHVPRELSRVCWYILQRRNSQMVCGVTESRRRSEVSRKCLVVPSAYTFTGKSSHIKRLMSLLN